MEPDYSRYLKIEGGFTLIKSDIIDYDLKPRNLTETFQRLAWGEEYTRCINNDVLGYSETLRPCGGGLSRANDRSQRTWSLMRG